MNLLGLMYLFGVATLITLFFGYALRVRGPWGSFWTFFVVILFVVMAVDMWVSPTGPYYRDIYWFPPLVAGFFIALVLAAATPSPKTRSRIERQSRVTAEENVVTLSLGSFFWVLFVFMVVTIIIAIIKALTS